MNIDAPKVGMKCKYRHFRNVPLIISENEGLKNGDELEIVGFPFVLARDKKGELHTLAIHEIEEMK